MPGPKAAVTAGTAAAQPTLIAEVLYAPDSCSEDAEEALGVGFAAHDLGDYEAAVEAFAAAGRLWGEVRGAWGPPGGANVDCNPTRWP